MAGGMMVTFAMPPIWRAYHCCGYSCIVSVGLVHSASEQFVDRLLCFCSPVMRSYHVHDCRRTGDALPAAMTGRHAATPPVTPPAIPELNVAFRAQPDILPAW